MIAHATPPRKKLIRREAPDYSQTLRRGIQLLFLLLNVWIGIQFYLFVSYYESGTRSFRVARPAGVEGWLPIASLMNLKVLLVTGEQPRIHPAGTLLLIAFLLGSWIFRKSFCGWLCPVGTVSEYLWRLGRKLFHRNYHIPRLADTALRGIKYLLLGLFVYAVVSMSVPAIHEFLDSPYGIVDDVKMLNFFRGLGIVGFGVIFGLTLGSVAVQNFWCRYFCPYGALFGLVSLASPLRIRRDAEHCVDCAKCAKACPSGLAVDRLVTIQSTECIGCLQCVASCPAEGALLLKAPRDKRVPPWVVGAGVVGIFLAAYIYGRISGHWDTQLSDTVYFRLIPRANEFGHP